MDYVHGRMGKMTCVFSLPPPLPRSNVLEWRLWFCFLVCLVLGCFSVCLVLVFCGGGYCAPPLFYLLVLSSVADCGQVLWWVVCLRRS